MHEIIYEPPIDFERLSLTSHLCMRHLQLYFLKLIITFQMQNFADVDINVRQSLSS